MPAVIVTELKYNQKEDFYYIYSYPFSSHFQNIRTGNYLFGNLEFCKIDKKVEKEVSKPVELQVRNSEIDFKYTSVDTIKKFGITPSSWICVVLENYSDSEIESATKYPIYPDYFEIIDVPEALREEVEKKFKSTEEVLKLIKLTGSAEELKEAFGHLEKAYSKFKANSYEDTKTSTRKVLEILREFTRLWKTIYGSDHLAKGINSLVDSLYNLSSSGGAHRGIATLDETEVILNSTFYIFKYVNKIIKEKRFENKDKNSFV